MDSNSELAVLFPTPRVETIAGVQVAIPTMKLRQMARFSTASAPFIARIVSADYLGAMMQHCDAVLDCVTIATGVERDWIETLDTDEALRLVAAVFEVNTDFFARRLLPVNREMGARMVDLLNDLGGKAASPG